MILENALAESIIGLFKAEVIKFLGPRKSVGQVERETLNYSIAQHAPARLTCSATLSASEPNKHTPIHRGKWYLPPYLALLQMCVAN